MSRQVVDPWAAGWRDVVDTDAMSVYLPNTTWVRKGNPPNDTVGFVPSPWLCWTTCWTATRRRGGGRYSVGRHEKHDQDADDHEQQAAPPVPHPALGWPGRRLDPGGALRNRRQLGQRGAGRDGRRRGESSDAPATTSSGPARSPSRNRTSPTSGIGMPTGPMRTPSAQLPFALTSRMTQAGPAVSTTRWRRETRLSSTTMSQFSARPTVHVRSAVIVVGVGGPVGRRGRRIAVAVLMRASQRAHAA